MTFYFIGMKTTFLAAVLFLSLTSADTWAQMSYETPQYSGPGARIEHGMNRDGNPRPVQSDPRAVSRNDRAFDVQSAIRHQKVTREMDMRRDETIRANQRYILKMNE